MKGRSGEMITVEQVRRRIEQALPGARVEVSTFQGEEHFQALVEAPQFEGKTLVEQHRMVYAALEGVLASREIAAFVVEPIQGHGVNVPGDDYLPEAARLCRRHGALFVADEVQTGLGRTGRLWAIEHWGVEPDMLLSAKALSGGFVPVGAVAMRKQVFDAVCRLLGGGGSVRTGPGLAC